MPLPNRLLATIAATLALLVACAGCTRDQVDPLDPGTASTAPIETSSPPSSSGEPPSTSSSPTLTPAEQAAVTAARPLVEDYFRVRDKSIQDPDRFDDSTFAQVAVSSALADAQDRLEAVRESNFHQTGNVVITDVSLLDVDLRFNPKRTPPYIPTVQFRVCYDVSGVTLVDKAGNSQTDPDRKPTGWIRVGVSNYEYPNGPWLTSYTDWHAGAAC